MCYYCHINLNNEDLNDLLDNIKTYNLNNILITSLILCASGFNGKEIREKSLNELDNYNYLITDFLIIKEYLKNNIIDEDNKIMLKEFCERFKL